MAKFVLFLLPILLYGSHDLYSEGKKLYFEKGCSSCHGVSASGSNQYPSLAYRRKEFLTHRLQQFRSRIGENQQSQMMIPFATGLKDGDIDAITTFLSTFKENGSTYKYDFSIRGDGGS
ncbi:MAG: cytochrome c [Sulfuricurvum sp.]